MKKVADKLTESSSYAIDSFSDFFDGVMDFENNDHWGTSSVLNSAIYKGKQAFKSCCERHNAAIKYTYYREDYRKDLVKRMNDEEDTIIAFFKDNYDDICEACKETLKRIDKEKTIIEELEKYKNVFMPALDMGIRMYQQQNKATHVDAMEYEIPNVFDSITKDNYKAFLRSFEDGVDLTICNINGYSPLTLAVALGNNPMVKFMLDHDADPSIKDRRGYNAFLLQ